MSELTILKTYYNKQDAEMAVGLLKDAGFEAILQSDDAGGFRPHLTLGMGNNRILVQKEVVEKALEVISSVQEELSEEELKRIEDLAVQSKEPDIPKKKRLKKTDLSLALPIIIAVVFLLSYVFQEIHKEKNYVRQYSNDFSCKYESTRKDAHGVCKDYYEDKKVHGVWHYIGDNAVGISKEFFHNGQVRWEGIYVNNKLNGPFKEYFESGAIRSEGNFKDNKKDGQVKEYYESGKIKESAHYKNDELHGNLKRYYENGNVSDSFDLKDGYRFDATGKKYQGLEKNYYEDGSLWEEWNYNNGRLEGLGKSYYKNGNVDFAVFYHQGKLNGEAKMYFKNGQVQYYSYYDNNIPTFMKEYDKEGTLIFKVTYK